MTQTLDDKPIPLARLDVRKSSTLAVVAFGLAILPNLSGMEDGFRTGFFYASTAGIALRWSATVVLVVIGGALAVGSLIALFKSAAVVRIQDGELIWGMIGPARVRLSEISDVSFDKGRRAVRLTTRDGRVKWLSISGLRSEDAPDRLLRLVKEATADSYGADNR